MVDNLKDRDVADIRSQEEDADGKKKNDVFPLFVGVLMTVLTLEQIRQLIFKGGNDSDEKARYEAEKMSQAIDNQRQLEMFDNLGKTRREEMSREKHDEGGSNKAENEETKGWTEEEEFESQEVRMLEALERQRKERRLSTHENLEITVNKDLQEIQIGQESTATVSQYIVLASNLVTCGPGLEIVQIIPGYNLCQVSLQLPMETTGTEIVEMLFEEGLESTDFHILRIEETEGRLEATILTSIRFGNAMESKGEVFRNHDVGLEVRRDAIWTAGTLGPGNKPSLVLTWDPEESSSFCGDISEIELAAVYDSLFDLQGVRMESCCLITPDSDSKTNQVTLTVEFDTWENTMEAARNVRSRSTENIRSFEAKTPNPYQNSIVIPLPQYEAQRRQWLELSDREGEEEQIEIEIIDDEAKIHVQGKTIASVGALKVRVEKLARGEVLQGPYWHPSFASPESSGFFSDVMESANVYLRCQPETNMLVLYGEPEYIERARMMIQAEVDRREQVMTKTALTGPSIEFFKNGGIQKLGDLVGEKNVDLKSTSRWSAIMMRGGEMATHHLRRLIKDSLANGPFFSQGPPDATTCPVCLERQLHPEMLDCGHGYCSGCLNFFLTAAADNQTFPIVCIGDGATCNIPIALPFINRFLPRHIFKRLVESAFATHLQQNPTQFRYCKTPDCRQTYRRESVDEATTITCPSCFATTCSSCSEDHENMTCVEYRILHDPEEQERLNNELANGSGYKRCPRCAVWVEKTGGCNHMTCRCGVHICWTCLGVFEPGEIYAHIGTHEHNDANFF